MAVVYPSEIITEILVKVACVKSLGRCMSVCKSWYSLIKDSYFITKHLSHQHKKNSKFTPANKRYLFCAFASIQPDELYPTFKVPYLEYAIHIDNTSLDEYYKLQLPCQSKTRRLVHGICNGLICYSRNNVTGTTTSLYLWNPTVKKLKFLSKFIHKTYTGVRFAFGLGYDPKSNDYKVLKISYLFDSSVVELYSLKTNSWTLISDNCPGLVRGLLNHNNIQGATLPRRDKLAFVNGKFYWEAHQRYVPILVSLDVNTNIICKTKMSEYAGLNFGALDGRNLLFVFGMSGNRKWFGLRCSDIQVFDKHSNKVFEIDDFKELSPDKEDQGLALIGLRNNGQVLFLDKTRSIYKYSDSLVTYNMKTRKAKDFGDKFSRQPCYVETFVESLVLLDDENAKSIYNYSCRR